MDLEFFSIGEDLSCMVAVERRCVPEPKRESTDEVRPDIGTCASQGCDPAIERLLGLCEEIAAPAVRWLNDPADIDEAIQRTRIQVHRKIGQKRDGSMRAWIRQIGVNEARQINRQRFGATRPLSGLPSDDSLDDRGLFKISTALADQELWRWAVTQLSEEQANAYLLREISALTYEEVAEQQRVPVNTAKTRVSRARRRLTELIMDRDPDRKKK